MFHFRCCHTICRDPAVGSAWRHERCRRLCWRPVSEKRATCHSIFRTRFAHQLLMKQFWEFVFVVVCVLVLCQSPMRCGGSGCGKEPTHTAPRLHIFIFGQMHCAMGMGQNPVFDCLLVITGQRELIFLEPKGCFQVSNWILYQFKGIRVGGVVWVSGRLVWKLLTNSRGTPYQRVSHISRNVFSHSLTGDAGTNRGLGNISALWFWPFYVPFHSYSDPAIHSFIFFLSVLLCPGFDLRNAIWSFLKRRDGDEKCKNISKFICQFFVLFLCCCCFLPISFLLNHLTPL